MTNALGSLTFLIMAPFLVAFLFVITLVTWCGEWWVQWAVLGLGIAWVINLLKVLRTAVVTGGLAALGMYLFSRRR